MESIDIKPAFTFSMFATSSQQRAFLEVFDGFEEEWEQRGYESLSASDVNQRLSGRPSYPETWKTKGPINFAFGPPHFIQFIMFLKEPATNAAIEVCVGGILHAVLKRFGRLFGNREEETKPSPQTSENPKTIQLPMKLCPTAWFAHEEVLVTVIADIETNADFKIAELLISEGFRRAGEWIAHHEVTHPYLTYHIRKGQLDSKPTLSERPLDEDTNE